MTGTLSMTGTLGMTMAHTLSMTLHRIERTDSRGASVLPRQARDPLGQAEF